VIGVIELVFIVATVSAALVTIIQSMRSTSILAKISPNAWQTPIPATESTPASYRRWGVGKYGP
jgi:hypothetical protein